MSAVDQDRDATPVGAASRPVAPRRRSTDLASVETIRESAPPQGVPVVARREALFRHPLVAADALAAIAATPLSVVLSGGGRAWTAALLGAPITVLLAKLMGLYEREGVVLRKSTLDEIPSVFQLATLSTLAIWLLEGPLGAGSTGRGDVLLLLGSLLVLLIAGRAAARRLSRVIAPVERCLLVGDPDARLQLGARLGTRKAALVGYLPLVERRQSRNGDLLPEPYGALESVVARLGVHRIIVAPGHTDSELVLNVVSRAKTIGVHVSILPQLFEVVGSSVEFDELEGLTMLGVHRFGLSRSSRLVKRATDVAGAVVALVVVSPLMALIAALIKLESPGPVFFRQPRVGRHGDPFLMIKFRSMHDGADEARALLAHLNEAGDGLFKVQDDPRLTRIGRIIRRYSLDELPQMLNVLRGEMSLVGPRPLVLEEDRQIAGWHRRRLDLTPGITGPWQVLGEMRVPLRDMVSIDYLYAANWSLWVDAKVLLRTAGHVIAGRGR
jgi:exopolysaccharide biosynthesis polyprenyl glycosylphosphotransferase